MGGHSKQSKLLAAHAQAKAPRIDMSKNKYYKSWQHQQQQDQSNTSSHTISSNAENNQSNLVTGRYSVGEKLGEGSFGEVRLALDTKNGREVAIKFEHKSDVKKHLNTEYRVYLKLKDCIGFPGIYWFGRYGDYTALVMDRLGISLKALYSRCNRIFPVQTVSLIGIQMLDRLETLHNAGWLHQDIKPENVVIGYKSASADNHSHSGNENLDLEEDAQQKDNIHDNINNSAKKFAWQKFGINCE